MLDKLKLTNFARFGDLPEINLSSRINIFIGENGTGKTQLLKAGYALCAACAEVPPETTKKTLADKLTEKLCATYRLPDAKVGKLVNHGAGTGGKTVVEATFALGERVQAEFGTRSSVVTISELSLGKSVFGRPTFIPTKEVISLLHGITSQESDRKTLEQLFDATYFDLCESLLAKREGGQEQLIEQDPRFGAIYGKLGNSISGRFVITAEAVNFMPGLFEERHAKNSALNVLADTKETVFVPKRGEELSAHMTAEGFRKLGILQSLFANRSLDPGKSGPLFWDEPETNMNPKLMRTLVEVLIELSRNGQQVILATHDYVLLKWFDLLMDKGKSDHVQYHALYCAENLSDIKVESVDTYHLLDKNAISNAFSDLYDAEIDRSLGAKK